MTTGGSSSSSSGNFGDNIGNADFNGNDVYSDGNIGIMDLMYEPNDKSHANNNENNNNKSKYW